MVERQRHSTLSIDYTKLVDLNVLQPRTFFYGSWGPTGLSQCSLTTTYIEAEIACKPSCAASRLRRSRLATNLPPAFVMIRRCFVGLGYVL